MELENCLMFIITFNLTGSQQWEITSRSCLGVDGVDGARELFNVYNYV